METEEGGEGVLQFSDDQYSGIVHNELCGDRSDHMSLHTCNTQMTNGIPIFDTLKAKTTNNNGTVLCTHAEKGQHR